MSEAEPEHQVRHSPAASAPRARLGTLVSETLAAMIDGGSLALGSRLPPERELMRQFRVSRAAVREAIAALANRGLLHVRPGHRPIVQRPSYQTAISTLTGLLSHLVHDEPGTWNLFETRVFVEAGLARNAALHARPDDIDELSAALAANRDAIGEDSLFYVTDISFHEVLYRIPRNPIYPAIHKAYVEWLMVHWTEIPRRSEIDRMNYAGHKAIHDAILKRDGDAAEAAMRGHLSTAWQFLRASVKTR